MSEEKKMPAEKIPAEPDDTISKVYKLQQRFYEVCGELYESIEVVGEPMYNLMLEHYFAQYKREYELMNAAEFINVDKHIEELKAERDREIEAVKLERDKQKRELEMIREREIKGIELDKAKLSEKLEILRERELEEVKIEHTKQTAEIERKREKLNNEIEVLWQTSVLENEIKLSRVIPQSWRRFKIFKWEFGRVCINEAQEYAEIAANAEIQEYLTKRAQEVSEASGEEIAEPEPMSEKEYKKWRKRFEKERRKRRREEEKPEESDEPEQAEEPQEAEAEETPEESDEPEPAASVSLIAEKSDSD